MSNVEAVDILCLYPEQNFLFLEYVKNKQWICYHREKYYYIPFGDMVCNVINLYSGADPDDMYHKEYLHFYEEGDMDTELMSSDAIKKDVSELKSLIEQLPDIRKKARKKKIVYESQYLMIKYWEHFRLLPYPIAFSEYLDAISKGLDKEDIMSETMYRVKLIRDKFFVFYDYVTLNVEGRPYLGRCFLAKEFDDCFGEDLYHLLVDGVAQVPRHCTECGHIFFSDKDSKYCYDCRKNYKKIRQRRRMEGPRYYHKKIYDSMSQSSKTKKQKYTEADIYRFRDESDAKWKLAQEGSKNGLDSGYPDSINTIEDYEKWLHDYYDNL